MPTHVLVTGGCGFIGSALVEYLLKNTDWEITIIDMLSYASAGYQRLREIGATTANPRIRNIIPQDLSQSGCLTLALQKEIGAVDFILHLAASTHVDHSISDPVNFVQNNVNSTLYMLEYARKLKPSLKRFLYFSTDECFGPAPDGVAFKEGDRHNPGNPYSASKSASEMICKSYANAYGIPLQVVNCMNAFGERQLAEKFIPLCIKKILAGEKIYVHTDPNGRPGSRTYIHSSQIARAVQFVITEGKIGESYNIAGSAEVDNLRVAVLISEILEKPLNYELISYDQSRPGHDIAYRLDASKLTAIGFTIPDTFLADLTRTVEWTLKNKRWLED